MNILKYVNTLQCVWSIRITVNFTHCTICTCLPNKYALGMQYYYSYFNCNSVLYIFTAVILTEILCYIYCSCFNCGSL